MNDKKKTSGKPRAKANANATKKAPVVKEVKVSEVANEDEDKKLIVVIAIAILIIIGTVIGLLVGCQRDEDKNETNQTNQTDIDIIDNDPISDKTDDEDEPYSVVRTESSTTTTKYLITYILDGEKVYSTNIESGKKVKKYTPSGYEDCTYFANSEMTNSFDFSKAPTDDTKVYMTCVLKEYTVTYKDSDGSLINSETLVGTETENYTVAGLGNDGFLGWSKNASSTISYKAGEKITVNSDLTLTAVYGATTVVYESALLKEVYVKDRVMPMSEVDEEGNIIPGTEYMPTDEEKEEMYGNETMIVPEFVDSVEVAYSQEEIDNYSLPSNPSEVGLEIPTYFVPSNGQSSTSVVIVDDDEDVSDGQVRIGDVQGRTPSWYTPAVNDNVEEKESEFVGWYTEGMDPLPSDYQPSTDGENTIVAGFDFQEEDKTPPAEPTGEPPSVQEEPKEEEAQAEAAPAETVPAEPVAAPPAEETPEVPADVVVNE